MAVGIPNPEAPTKKPWARRLMCTKPFCHYKNLTATQPVQIWGTRLKFHQKNFHCIHDFLFLETWSTTNRGSWWREHNGTRNQLCTKAYPFRKGNSNQDRQGTTIPYKLKFLLGSTLILPTFYFSTLKNVTYKMHPSILGENFEPNMLIPTTECFY